MQPRSLRTHLLLWLLLPVAAIAIVDGYVSYRAAVRTAQIVQEQLLLGAARVIGEQVRVEDGALQVVVPPAALEMFASPSGDRVFYRATAADGSLLTGYYDLPLPPTRPQAEQASYFDAVLRERPVHVVAFAQPVFAETGGSVALIEVAQTLSSRTALAREIWQGTIARHLALVPLLAFLLWLGLRRGMHPVLALVDRVRDRQPGAVETLDLAAAPVELQPLVAAFNEYARRLDSYVSAQSRFIADASHQLRTPLALLSTQLAYARRNDGDEREDALRASQATVQHGMRLVNQLLSLTAVEGGVAEALAPEQVDLTAIVKQVLEGESWLAQERGIDLGFEGDSQPVVVHGHAHLLVELLANLVDNALRYTPRDGRVTVRVHSDGASSVLVVEDDGSGIPVADRERVFDRFCRLENSRSDGSGLGLAIVREIAQLHAAPITLETPPGGRGLLVKVVFRAPLAGH
jgi:two-component system sensor histidine kinase TctE